MAVAKVSKRRPWRVDVRAWLGPRDGPGKLYRIRNGECFFLPIFRLQSVYLGSGSDLRCRAWGSEVLDACCPLTAQLPISASATQTQSLRRSTLTPQNQDLPSKSQRDDLFQPVLSTNEATNSHGCEDLFDFEAILNGEGQEALEKTNEYNNEDPFGLEALLNGEGQVGLEHTDDYKNKTPSDFEAFINWEGQ